MEWRGASEEDCSIRTVFFISASVRLCGRQLATCLPETDVAHASTVAVGTAFASFSLAKLDTFLTPSKFYAAGGCRFIAREMN